ncbi:MAG: response regulator [Desulfobacterales bacterium]|nr:MAG: response regulator [Desulfobacterales bacterium]
MIKTVLFVDDNQILCRFIRKKFDRCKDTFIVITATDGLDALEKIKEKNISLVITNLHMPRMDGFALLTQLAEHYPDIPVIVQTGQGTTEAKRIVLDMGAISYIEQPFKVEDLGNLVLSTLEKEYEGGILKTFSLDMFIQLIEMEMKTCTVRATEKSSGKQGTLFFREGDLMDARLNNQHGKQAAFEIFCWDNITLSIQDECRLTKKSVNGDLQSLLFEAIRFKDEVAASQQEITEKTDKSQLSAFEDQKSIPSDSDIESSNTFSLKDIFEIENVEGVMSFSLDGKPGYRKFASHQPDKIDEINWLSLFQTLGGIHEADLVFEDMRFFVRRIAKGYILVFLGKTVPVEMVRRSCERLVLKDEHSV